MATGAGAGDVAAVEGVGDEVVAGRRNHTANIIQAMCGSAACSYKRTSSRVIVSTELARQLWSAALGLATVFCMAS